MVYQDFRLVLEFVIMNKYFLKIKTFQIKMFSGNKDVDLYILEKLDDKTLLNFCLINKHMYCHIKNLFLM